MSAHEDPLAGLTLETFSPHVGQTLSLTTRDGATFDADLVEARDESRPDGRHGPIGGRAPFSLTFRPRDGQAWPQSTYTLTLDGMTLSIFCVPILSDDATPRLQASFN